MKDIPDLLFVIIPMSALGLFVVRRKSVDKSRRPPVIGAIPLPDGSTRFRVRAPRAQRMAV